VRIVKLFWEEPWNCFRNKPYKDVKMPPPTQFESILGGGEGWDGVDTVIRKGKDFKQ